MGHRHPRRETPSGRLQRLCVSERPYDQCDGLQDSDRYGHFHWGIQSECHAQRNGPARARYCYFHPSGAAAPAREHGKLNNAN